MAFPPSFIDTLVERNPIEDVVGQYVNLRRSGSNLFGLCPFHGEKTASFSVAPDKGLYYCFGCHKGGGVINFQMEIENLSYPDAVRALAKRAGLTVPEDDQYESRYRQQERLWALCKEAARFFHACLFEPQGAKALGYASGRGMSKGVLTAFGLGYAPDSWDSLIRAMHAKGYTDQELIDAGLVSKGKKNEGKIYDRFRNRLMFPIIDVRGNVIGFGGRVMDDSTPKYLNSPETLIFNKRKNLFALNVAKKSKLPYMILVEGYMDAISLHQYGFDCAVASLGTALTEDGANLLSRYTDQVVLIYDGDSAGQNATQRAIPILEKADLRVRVLQMRDAKDPDEYLKKFGADRFKLLLEEASNRVEYQLAAILKKHDLRQDEGRIRYVQEAAELLCTLGNPTRQEVYGRRVAETASVSYEAVQSQIKKAQKSRRYREKKQQEEVSLAPVRNLLPPNTSIRYDNPKSARAEERILAMVLCTPVLLDQMQGLEGAHFSSPLLGRVYEQLLQRYRNHQDVSIAVLEGLSQEEMAHLVRIAQQQEGPVSPEAFGDCVRTVRDAHQSAAVSSDEDLLALQKKLQDRKGRKA